MLRIDVEHAGGEYLVGLHGWLTGEERQRGARLTGASPYIELLLEGAVFTSGGDSK